MSLIINVQYTGNDRRGASEALLNFRSFFFRCIDGINAFQCECKDGFDGLYCENKIDE